MTLTDTGVAVLLVYGAEIFPPRPGRPGVNAIVYADGTVLLEPGGFSSRHAAAHAVSQAAEVCYRAGLDVTDGPRPRTRLVRKRTQGGPA